MKLCKVKDCSKKVYELKKEKIIYSYCENHYKNYIEDKDYEVSDFHLAHGLATYDKSYKKILKSQFLLSTKERNVENEDWLIDLDKNYENTIFTSLIVPINDDRLNLPGIYNKNKYSFKRVYFILKSELLRDFVECSDETPYLCHIWTGGKFNPEYCSKYDKKKSLKENLNLWRREILSIDNTEIYGSKFGTNIYGGPPNEIAVKNSKDISGKCLTGKISLNKYLNYVFISNDEEKEILAKEFPEYKFI